jgi:hypothetical protein
MQAGGIYAEQSLSFFLLVRLEKTHRASVRSLVNGGDREKTSSRGRHYIRLPV